MVHDHDTTDDMTVDSTLGTPRGTGQNRTAQATRPAGPLRMGDVTPAGGSRLHEHAIARFPRTLIADERSSRVPWSEWRLAGALMRDQADS